MMRVAGAFIAYCVFAHAQPAANASAPSASPTTDTNQEIRVPANKDTATRCKASDPEYPPEARKLGVTGDVQLTARVDSSGRLFDLVARYARPGTEALARATMREALMWRAHPAMDATCKPVDTELNAVVTFAIEDGAPVVLPRVEVRALSNALPMMPRLRNEKEVMRGIRFPFTAMEDGLEATLFVAVEVDAKSGKALDVRVVARDAGPRVGSFFDAQVIAAFRKAEFDPVPDAPEPALRYCRSVDFCIPK